LVLPRMVVTIERVPTIDAAAMQIDGLAADAALEDLAVQPAMLAGGLFRYGRNIRNIRHAIELFVVFWTSIRNIVRNIRNIVRNIRCLKFNDCCGRCACFAC
jgi:hypothetical protein